MESPSFCVYEKLRLYLSTFAGVAGFHSLVSRALTLAKAEAPSLSAMQVTADGCISDLRSFDSQTHNDQDSEAGVILIAMLLRLLRTFIGEAVTLRLLKDIWPDVAFGDFRTGTGEKREHTR